MANEVLNSLLKEYEQKKLRAEIDLENRKETLYNKIPRLKQIEENLNKYAISTAKNILKKDSYSIEDLKKEVNKIKKEKLEILNEYNLPYNYLQPFYECIVCKDTGYIMDKQYKTKMCNCLKQKLLNDAFHKSNLPNIEKENFSTFNENLFSDDIDLSKYKLNISPRKNIINIKNNAIEFVNNFDNPDQKNLLFTGNTGLR